MTDWMWLIAGVALVGLALWVFVIVHTAHCAVCQAGWRRDLRWLRGH